MFKFKQIAAERNPVIPPQAIIDNFRDDIKAQREYHNSEVMRLRTLIEDATARLGNHMTALEACDRVLETVRVEQALTIANLDFAVAS